MRHVCGGSVALVLGCWLLCAGLARAQEETYTRLTPEDLEKVLKDAKVRFSRDKEKATVFTCRLGDYDGTLYLLRDGAALLLRASLKGGSLEAANRWNDQKAILERAYHQPKDGFTYLEAGLDCTPGIGVKHIKALFAEFRQAIPTFEEFIDKEGKQAPGAKAASGLSQVIREQTDDKSGLVEIGFPSRDNPATAWHIRWRYDETPKGSHGLIITGAWFKQDQDWLKVLEEARVAELYVPYYESDTEFFDIREKHTAPGKVPADAVGTGRLLSNGRAALELRDRGVLWLNPAPPATQKSYRGQEAVLWGLVEAGYYTYLMQYSFRDDGSIAFRSGSTGHNQPKKPHEPHMHTTCWRIDIDLGGSGPGAEQARSHGNTPYLIRHLEPGGNIRFRGEQKAVLFNSGREGPADWDPKQFTVLRIINNPDAQRKGLADGATDLEKLNSVLAYDLVPLRSGSARHLSRPNDFKRQGWHAFTQKDFWVTGYRNNEFSPIDLPANVQRGEPLVNSDLVVWYNSSELHIPRDEDMRRGEGHQDRARGGTLVLWSGFDLRPRNLFRQTPFLK
jgi:hypothetical protein